jgi:hypothetical protein
VSDATAASSEICLFVGARLRRAVGPPPVELGGVTEAVALHVLVAHFNDALRSEWHEGQVLLGIPPGPFVPARGVHVNAGCLLRRPVPRMPFEIGHKGLKLFEQSSSRGHREGADHPNRYEGPIPIQAEQKRADRVSTTFMHPVTGDDTVGGTDVLDLEHDPLVGLVGAVERFRDYAIEPGPLQLGEPTLGLVQIRRDWG